MALIGSFTAAAVVLVTAALAGCGSPAPGQVAARDACKAYANTTRHQVTDTAAAGAEAQSDALRAASANARWRTLQNDIQGAYSIMSFASATNEEMDAHFAADRRVQADCKAAGQDIGDLLP